MYKKKPSKYFIKHLIYAMYEPRLLYGNHIKMIKYKFLSKTVLGIFQKYGS